LLNIKVEANSSIADARLIATNVGPKIEYNPQQPRERVRFSIAHEVAHLLFPDWQERIRNRGGDKASSDDWQLEMLCNLAASEFVLPIGSLSIASTVPSMEDLMRQCRDYDVSVEAFLIRLAKISNQPIGVFVASSAGLSDASRRYAIDYFVGSPVAPQVALKSVWVPSDSVIRSCTAIGYTNHSVESWIIDTPTLIECVGIPGYPGSMFPRVAGLVRFDKAQADRRPIRVVHGNILEPRSGGPKIICQLVNDKAISWGGGVAKKVATRFPHAEAAFKEEMIRLASGERLGRVIFARGNDEITVASLIAQEGYGPSLFPRIRYEALRACLEAVAERAQRVGASIHMPRIGTGSAGGDWGTVEELLDDVFVRAGLFVTIYDIPPKRPQLELF
jgi:O-acetyl-ADP-ribose deacetylase (regulator of RNase III)